MEVEAPVTISSEVLKTAQSSTCLATIGFLNVHVTHFTRLRSLTDIHRTVQTNFSDRRVYECTANTGSFRFLGMVE